MDVFHVATASLDNSLNIYYCLSYSFLNCLLTYPCPKLHTVSNNTMLGDFIIVGKKKYRKRKFSFHDHPLLQRRLPSEEVPVDLVPLLLSLLYPEDDECEE